MTAFTTKMEGYYIFNPATGLYSRGGSNPKWGKSPKIWSNVAHLKNHLNMLLVYADYGHKNIKFRQVYKGCILYDVVTQKPATNIGIYEYIDSYIYKTYTSKPYYQDYKIVEVQK